MIKHTRKSLSTIKDLIAAAEHDIANTKQLLNMAAGDAETTEYNWQKLKREVEYLSELQAALVYVGKREALKAKTDKFFEAIEDLLSTQK